MKMRWEEPRIEVQKFEANEYVAACFVCDGPSGILYKESGDNPGFDRREDDPIIGANKACDSAHPYTEKPSTSTQTDGYIVWGNNVTPVKYIFSWTHKGYHAMLVDSPNANHS